MTTSQIDKSVTKGVLQDIKIDRSGGAKTLVVENVQDVDPILGHNMAMRQQQRTDKNRGEGRVIADVPRVIYLEWIKRYGFDMLSPARSNWGMGMTREEHKKFLRSLLNSNPMLKTVDESL